MSGESYSLSEVAELLGVSKRTLQRQIRDGAFPGRFLAPSPHGMEMRIPAAEVMQARGMELPDGVAIESEPPLRQVGLAPVAADEADGSISWTASELQSLREGVLEVVREEREVMLAEVRGVLQEDGRARSAQIEELRATVQRMADELAKLRELMGDRSTMGAAADGQWADVMSSHRSELDVDGLLTELGELEAMLGVSEN